MPTYERIVNKEKKEATLRMFGVIGKDLDGNQMAHDPFFSGKGSDKLSAKDVKALDSIKDTLQTILSRRGCDKEKIADLMKNETWFNAEEAKTSGLIDEVVSTPRKEELSNLSTQELMNRVMNEYQPKKSFNMNEIAKALGLPDHATEQQILDAIRAKDKTVNDRQTALTDHYMLLGVKNGVVTEKNKDKMQRLAAADFDLFAEMAAEVSEEDTAEEKEENASVKKPKGATAGAERLSTVLAGLKTTGTGFAAQKGGKTAKSYDWYQKNDPRALARLESENPKEFDRLLNEYESNME